MSETPLFGSRVIAIVIALYVALVLFASFHFNISLTADRVAVLLVILALGTGRIRMFLRDWSVFVIVVLAWQVLQGMSHTVTGFKPHVTEMIIFDRFVFFGHVPTVWLQQHLYHPGPIAWYDVGATILYMLHFVFPLAVGFALWLKRRSLFTEYTGSFLLLALAGFATFVLFPAAPPWWAARWQPHISHLPHVTKIFNHAVTVFGGKQSYSSVTHWAWSHGGWDQFGAMPSEHAGFPFLGFLYVRKAWNRAGWALLAYCIAVWLSVMYMGEHYFADVLAGVVYAALAFAVVQLVVRQRDRRARQREAGEELDPSVPESALA
ncbi:MAG: phosphatase PAP2 family protein [Chloroflexota bacterium]